MLAGDDQFRGYDAVVEDLAAAIDVSQEGVEGGHPLGEAGLELLPLGRRDQARQQVERERPLDIAGTLAAGVDGEGDPLCPQG